MVIVEKLEIPKIHLFKVVIGKRSKEKLHNPHSN